MSISSEKVFDWRVDATPELIEFHQARIRNEALTPKEREKSMLWLAFKGKLPAEFQCEPEPEAPQKAGLLAQGNPTPKALARERAEREASKRTLCEIWLDKHTPADETWLWLGRLVIGKANLIVGDGGSGKSTVVAHIAAVVSAGRAFPDAPHDPVQAGTVIFLVDPTEDGADEIQPKIKAFGGDPSKVCVISMVKSDLPDDEHPFALWRDMPLLEQLVIRCGDVRMIVVDPVGAYFGGANSFKDDEVRERLRPLFQLAKKYRIAVLLVMHLTKDTDKDVKYRIQGSAAFFNNARMAWFFSEDPNDPTRRLMSFLKANPKGSKKTALAVSYPKEEKLVWDPEPVRLSGKEVGRLLSRREDEPSTWGGQRGPEASEQARAALVIETALEIGMFPVALLRTLAVKKAGVCRRTADRALERLVTAKVAELCTNDQRQDCARLTPTLPLGDEPSLESMDGPIRLRANGRTNGFSSKPAQP